jgi:hypothetical protein
MIEAAAGRTEKERKIPADVLSAMHACGLFHMLLPVSLGGAAVDLVTFNQVVEAVAAADASPAWCLAQAVASSHAAGFLDPKIAREVFGAPDALVAWGPPAGVAKAIIVDGGYRVTGKWRFASGSANATWMGGHSTVFEAADRPRRNAGGTPVNRTMLFRREQANIKDTWHVIGLRGTASNDYEVVDLFVREEYTTWRGLCPRPPRERAALQHSAAHPLWRGLFRRGTRHRWFVPCCLHAARADQELRRGPGLDRCAARQCGDPIARRAGVRTAGLGASISRADAA